MITDLELIMELGVVAFGIVLIIATIQWFVDGRQNFKGPVSEEVLVATQSADTSNGVSNGHVGANEKDVVNGESSNESAAVSEER